MLKKMVKKNDLVWSKNELKKSIVLKMTKNVLKKKGKWCKKETETLNKG